MLSVAFLLYAVMLNVSMLSHISYYCPKCWYAKSVFMLSCVCG